MCADRHRRYQVVILADIGYVQQSRKEPEVLFTFLAECNNCHSAMIGSNLVFTQWDQIVKSKMTTWAAIDRLARHAIILEFDRSSFPMKKSPAPEEPKQQIRREAIPPVSNFGRRDLLRPVVWRLVCGLQGEAFLGSFVSHGSFCAAQL